MKHAYVALSFQHRYELAPVISVIRECLQLVGVHPVVFVELYQFEASQEREMMTKALNLLRESDLLIAEVTHKAVGVGIEIGYAVARDLPIIYLRHHDAEYSTTVGGVATHSIFYTDADDLKTKLHALLRDMME